MWEVPDSHSSMVRDVTMSIFIKHYGQNHLMSETGIPVALQNVGESLQNTQQKQL